MTKYAEFKNIAFNYTLIEPEGYDDDREDFVRISESVEVDFVALRPEEVIPVEIEFLEKAKKTLHAEYLIQAEKVEEKIARLRAITHQPDV